MTRLDEVVDGFASLRALVVGDTVLDRYLWGRSAGLCREGPVPRIELDTVIEAPGGAGNTAANCAALGAPTILLSASGADAEGMALDGALREHGVHASVLPDPERRTVVKQRLFAEDQLLARFDSGHAPPLAPALRASLLDRLRTHWHGADVVIVADYDLGVCGDAVVAEVAALQAAAPRVLVVDARKPLRWSGAGALAAKPNADEAAAVLGMRLDHDRARVIAEHGERMLDLLGSRLAAVTLDRSGVVLLERGRTPHFVAGQPSPPRQAAGAGDTFVAVLALALGAGADGPMAAELAAAAAGVAVSRPCTAVCTAADLRRRLAAGDKRLTGAAELAEAVTAHRQQGRRIVFTNGCFDLLHRGHVSYLNRAKLLGDVLVVAVNDDAGVRRLKGPDRPVQPLEDRLQVLAALGCVDHVVAFAEDSPAALLAAARPDLYVKGGDYTVDTLPEAELVERLGGAVRLLPYVEDRSTTGIIDTIRAAVPGPKAPAR